MGARVIGVGDVLLKHAMGVEERTIEGNGGPHYGTPLLRMAIIEGKDSRFQPVVQTRNLVLLRITIRYGPAGDPFYAALNPPTIQYAQAGDAVKRRLIPLVPDASKGRRGVFSQRSTPAVSIEASFHS